MRTSVGISKQSSPWSGSHELSTDCYQELRKLARCCLGRKRSTDTLGTTALVHETYARIISNPLIDNDQQAIRRCAARAMRSVIVDYARNRNAQKRKPAGQRIPLDKLVDELEKPLGRYGHSG